jgi:hypothetical protein
VRPWVQSLAPKKRRKEGRKEKKRKENANDTKALGELIRKDIGAGERRKGKQNWGY